MPEACRIDLLGGLRVRHGDREIHRFRTQKTAALLAYLAYHLDRMHSREVLADLLWPSSDPQAGRTTLRVALNSLHRQLEPDEAARGTLLLTDRFSAGLNAQTVTTDVAEFTSAVRRASASSDDDDRLVCLREAVEAYGGELLPGHYHDWIYPERDRLGARFQQVVRDIVGALASRGAHEEAIDYARRGVAADPLSEKAHARLIRLLAECGQAQAVRRQYDVLTCLLRDELGDEPSPETRALADRWPHSQGGGAEGQVRQTATRARGAPSGTVAFLALERPVEDGGGDPSPLSNHASAWTLARGICRARGGQVAGELGARCAFAFARPSDALQSAIACQHSGIALRTAEDVGEAKARRGRYEGAMVRRVSALAAAANSGQVLCSEQAAVLLRDNPELGARLVDLGLYRLPQSEEPQRVFGVEFPGMVRLASSVPRAELAYRGNLPRPLTRFYGRQEELAALREALADDDTRLVSITGPGGCGKTRLALELGHDVRDAFLGAVGFATLQEAQPMGRLADAIASQLGLPGGPRSDPLGRVVMAASGQPTLLILDNLEHILGDIAPIVCRLLQETPTLTCLVTSRSHLAIEGEKEFRLAPLPVPPQPVDTAWVSQCPSVQLFVDRAERASPGFSLTARNADAVAQICSQLEGLPLALELAAARLNTMSLSQMRAGLAEGSAKLVARRRDIPSRQHSLRATYEWSRALLSDPLRAFHARLTVFSGGWTADAAAAVCAEPAAAEYLADLYDWSLVHVSHGEDAEGTVRYGMLESLRAYGREHVPGREWTKLRRSHAHHYACLAQQLGKEASGPTQQACLRELDAEHGNWRSAMEWLSRPAEDLTAGLRMAVALFAFWVTRGHLLEGSRFVEALLSRGDASQAGVDYARALETAGKLAYRQGDVRAAVTYCEKGLTACREADDHEGVARCLNALANAVAARGDAEGAQRRLREALDAARSIGDIGLEATTLHNMASVSFRRGDLAEVEALYKASLALRRELGARRGEADALIGLGNVSMQRGDSAQAHLYYDQALAVCRELGFSAGVAGCQQNLAILAERSGDLRTALELHQDSLRIRRELHDRRGVADSVHGLAVVEHRRGNWARAKDLYAEALGLHREVGDRYGEALALVGMGELALDGGQVAQAREHLETGLPITLDIGHKDAIARGLLLSARLRCRLRELERAAKLLGAAEAVFDTAGMPAPAQVAELEEVLTQGDFAEARAVGRNTSVAAAVRLALGRE